MADKNWETLKMCYCERIGQQVGLEAEVIYPADFLSDQPARVTAHRCSNAAECNGLEKASCVWAGTNPGYDPFEK